MRSLIDFFANVMAPKTASDVVMMSLFAFVGLLCGGYLIYRGIREQSAKRAQQRKRRLFDLDSDEVPDTAAALRRFEGQYDEEHDVLIRR